MKGRLLVLFLALTVACFAQKKSYQYFKKNIKNRSVYILVHKDSLKQNSKDTITIEKFSSAGKGKRSGSVISEGQTFTIYQEPKKNIYQIRDSLGTVLASIDLGNKTMFDVTLANGNKYDFQGGITASKWKYVSNQTVITCEFKKGNGKWLLYDIHGNQEDLSILLMISHLHGAYLIDDKSRRGLIYVFIIGLGIISAAAAN